jgi:geranylgeranyl diphosphate synthase type I
VTVKTRDPGSDLADRDSRHPLEAEHLRARVHDALDAFLTRRAELLHEVSPGCDELVQAVRELLAGGKRLRPAFCYWAWRASGGEDDAKIAWAAASLELFQAAALIHDDLMDGSDTRRGTPSVHRRFEARHHTRGDSGDGRRFGLAGAVLAGDLCLGWSDEMFVSCGLDPAAVGRGLEVFHQMRTQLMGGQFVDMLNQAGALEGHGDPVSRALQVITYKSAKYSVEHPLLIGARMAGAAPDLLRAFSAFGLPLGTAFQLRDDLLGVFGDPASTGKPAGDDLREGKRTVLVAKVSELADAGEREEFDALFGDPGLTPADISRLRAIITGCGAVSAVETMIDENVARARSVLALGSFAEPAASVLGDLVDAATSRVA